MTAAWPRCFGRYATCAKAQRGRSFQPPDGLLTWRVVFEPERDWEHPWALYAHNPYHERRTDEPCAGR